MRRSRSLPQRMLVRKLIFVGCTYVWRSWRDTGPTSCVCFEQFIGIAGAVIAAAFSNEKNIEHKGMHCSLA